MARANFRRDQAQVRLYSAMVRWMKVLLPIGSVALIGLIFLSGRERNAVVDVATLNGDAAALAAGLKLDNPRFTGVTDDGDPFIVTAEWALPDGALPDRIELERPEGELRLGSGTTLRVTALSGDMQRKKERLDLVGDVELRTSDGYFAQSDRVELNLSDKSALVPGRIVATGPTSRLEADRMIVTRRSADANDVIVHFQGNVRVRLRPEDGAPGQGGDPLPSVQTPAIGDRPVGGQ